MYATYDPGCGRQNLFFACGPHSSDEARCDEERVLLSFIFSHGEIIGECEAKGQCRYNRRMARAKSKTIDLGEPEIQKQILQELQQLVAREFPSIKIPSARTNGLEQVNVNEIYDALEQVGADQYLLATVGSWGDTLTAEDILELLQDRNREAA